MFSKSQLEKMMANRTPEQVEADRRFAELSAQVRAINDRWSDGRIRMPALVPFVVLSVSTCDLSVIVTVYNSYEIRDALRNAGLRYGDRSWYARCDSVSEAEKLSDTLNGLGVQLGDGIVR